MATFAKPAFNAASYAAFRPTYPQALYDFVYAYHARSGQSAQWKLAVDLGCGTGQATTALTRFDHIIGVDPSELMIQKARASSSISETLSRITYIKHAAEELDFLDSGSVDLVISAQAVHWFDYAKLWPQLARVMRQDGSAAFWGYSQFRIADHPSLTPIIHAYCQGTNPTESVGPYWEQPGRSILDNHLRDIPRAPEDMFKAHEHIFWTGTYYPTLARPRPLLLQKRMPWAALQAYMRTFSALHTYHEQNPADAARRTNLAHRPSADMNTEADNVHNGDVVERFWWSLKEQVAREKGEEGEEVVVEWPLAMLLFKKA